MHISVSRLSTYYHSANASNLQIFTLVLSPNPTVGRKAYSSRLAYLTDVGYYMIRVWLHRITDQPFGLVVCVPVPSYFYSRLSLTNERQGLIAQATTLKTIYEPDYSHLESKYNSPSYSAHRVDLRNSLKELAL